MLALAAAGLEEDSPLLFSDNPGKTAPDASICSFKHFFTASPPAVIKLTASAYERSDRESVVYEAEGDHLG